jgi:hypothetical protein
MTDPLSREKLYLWALLRIARGDATGDPELDAAGFSKPVTAPVALAEAALHGEEEIVTETCPVGLDRAMIVYSP